MNKRIKKKKIIQYIKSYMKIKNTKNMKINWNCPVMTYGHPIMSINERYQAMIRRRTRANAYHETMIKWYHWFTRR